MGANNPYIQSFRCLLLSFSFTSDLISQQQQTLKIFPMSASAFLRRERPPSASGNRSSDTQRDRSGSGGMERRNSGLTPVGQDPPQQQQSYADYLATLAQPRAQQPTTTAL